MLPKVACEHCLNFDGGPSFMSKKIAMVAPLVQRGTSRAFEERTFLDDVCQPHERKLIHNLTLPYFEHTPSPRLDAFSIRPIALLRPRDLRQPIALIRLNLAAACSTMRTTVPETAMHEYAQAFAGEHDVGTPGKVAPMYPEAQPICMEEATNRQLWLGVGPTYAAHDFAAAARADMVHGRTLTGHSATCKPVNIGPPKTSGYMPNGN
jgi:hypothetical protein